MDWLAKNPRLSWNPTSPTDYHDFRTGLTFAEVRSLLWSPSLDPTTWRHKRRGTVLGLWHQLKHAAYAEYLTYLEHAPQQTELPHAEREPVQDLRDARLCA